MPIDITDGLEHLPRRWLQHALRALFLLSLVGLALTGLALKSSAERVGHSGMVAREVVGGLAEIRGSSAKLAHQLSADHGSTYSVDDIAISYGLARGQLDVSAADVELLDSPRADELYSELTDLYNRLDPVVTRAKSSGEFDYSAAEPIAEPLRVKARQLVDIGFEKVRIDSATDGISDLLEAVVVAIPTLAVILLFALNRVTNRDMRTEFQRAKAKLMSEDAHRRRLQRISKGQAEALQLVAEGAGMELVTASLDRVVGSETNGRWQVTNQGLKPTGVIPEPLDEDLASVVRQVIDVATERDRVDKALVHEATHDSLTGLMNRASITAAVGSLMSHRDRRFDVAFLFVDLDRFTQANDTFGHQIGDQILMQVADRLRSAARDGDLIGRTGGDEFGLLLQEASSEVAWEVAEQIVDAIDEPFHVNGIEVIIGASVGIVVAGPDSHDADMLLSEADQAMYNAKSSGKPIVEIDGELRDKYRQRGEMEANIREALRFGGFVIYYQPIVDVVADELMGVEALVRMRIGDEIAAPHRFLPIAEETGLVVGIDRLVLAEASHQVAEWNRRFGLNLELSVNMSGVHINRVDSFRGLETVMKRSGLPLESLVMEITEGVFVDDWSDAARRIGDVRRAGVRFAIDDFGTGYSSLAYLQRLPVDILKIDRAFVGRLGASPGDDAIVRNIIELAGALELGVIAEGVEEPQQLETLKAMGITLCQGYHFAKPVDADHFAARWFGTDR